ncbi:MAG: glutamate--tRNA ligase [Gammaproteobacteria bacterium]|nr:glutamate--tRNA ligase [Gammaproteobacteria bacterium]
MTVRTRFPPSPTGMLHIGSARTALFNWLYARKLGGTFILRIEDTDLERSTEDAVQIIFEGMAWLGLDYDEGPYYQTRRFDRYREVIGQMLAAGTAYHCYCSREEIEAMRTTAMARGDKPRYDGRCRQRSGPPPAGIAPVVRFRNPTDGEVVVEDRIHGMVRFANRELDDLIIARSDGSPTYNFTVVVDDMDMAITHVIRGDDHLNNTPRQLNILAALGAPLPVYAHVPMILGPDGKKLSKRHGAVSVMQYRDEGFLPEALLNYLVRMGWAHGDDEIFSIAEMIDKFDIAALNKSAAAVNPDKLLWLNQHYIKTLAPDSVGQRLRRHLADAGVDWSAGPPIAAVVEALRERARTLVEMADACRYFYVEPRAYEDKAARAHLGSDSAPVLADLRERLAAVEPWTREAIHAAVAAVAAQRDLKLGKVAQPLRVALTGGTVSPPIDVTCALIGREGVSGRLDRALVYIRNSLKP